MVCPDYFAQTTKWGTVKVANCSQTGRDALRGRVERGIFKSSYERAASVAQLLATAVVLTTASYLHDTRLLRILAVLAAILTTFFALTITCGVRALVFILVLSHVNYLLLDPLGCLPVPVNPRTAAFRRQA